MKARTILQVQHADPQACAAEKCNSTATCPVPFSAPRYDLCLGGAFPGTTIFGSSARGTGKQPRQQGRGSLSRELQDCGSVKGRGREQCSLVFKGPREAGPGQQWQLGTTLWLSP